MAEEDKHPPHRDIVKTETAEALFKEKLKAAELYTARVIQDARYHEMVTVAGEEGCHVYSATRLQEAFHTLNGLPDDHINELLEKEQLSDIRRVSDRFGDQSSNEMAEPLGISLRAAASPDEDILSLEESTPIQIEIGQDGRDRLAQTLADDPQIRALIWNEEFTEYSTSGEKGREYPLKSTLLDGKDAGERRQLFASFLTEAKTRDNKQRELYRKGNRMWLARVNPQETEMNLIHVYGEVKDATMPLQPTEDKRPGISLILETHRRLGMNYVSDLMQRLGENGLRASINPSKNTDAAFSKSWIVNDDSLPKK